jgi:hypothetical protein
MHAARSDAAIVKQETIAGDLGIAYSSSSGWFVVLRHEPTNPRKAPNSRFGVATSFTTPVIEIREAWAPYEASHSPKICDFLLDPCGGWAKIDANPASLSRVVTIARMVSWPGSRPVTRCRALIIYVVVPLCHDDAVFRTLYVRPTDFRRSDRRS